jgi:uncharacterized phage protein gp47/JayE
MTEETTTETAQPTQTENAGQPAGPDLNVSDLIALKNIIEIASQRGAFKAAELEAVGKTFNKLATFLESVTKKEA